jgi:hypothetical protein
LQPFSKSNWAKDRLIPEPAPVMIAVLDATFMAIVTAGGYGQMETRGD